MIGILGGMGPLATIDFLQKLVSVVPGERDQDHLPTVVYSDPSTPDRSAAQVAGGPSPLPAMLRGVRFLESAGVGVIAIPCNSAHLWFAELQAAVATPILHIADAVVARLIEAGHRPGARIGVLSTDGTRRSGLYQDRLEAAGFVAVVPSDEVMGTLVTPGITAVKAGELEGGRKRLSAAAGRLEHDGAEEIVLGCTDISVVLTEQNSDHDFLDSNLSLAYAAAATVLGDRSRAG